MTTNRGSQIPNPKTQRLGGCWGVGFGSRHLGFVLALVVAACSPLRVDPANARHLIETHPRFSAPDTIRVPAEYCTADVADPAPNPGQGVSRIKMLRDAQVIRLTARPAGEGECHPGYHARVTVALTDVASSFHPTPLPETEGRGWEFVTARRRFIAVHDVSYDDPDNPKIAHVGYAWTWEPTLLGQLLEIGSVQQGASATLLRDGNGWIVRQPGM